MPTAEDSAYLLGKRRTLVVFAGLLLGMLLAALNQTIVSTALPGIVADLGGFEHYSWVFSAYMLTATVTVPLYGKLSDIYGRRPLFALAIVLFMAGSVVSGLAPSMSVLIFGRAIQGLGAGGLIPLVMAVIGDLIAPRERGKWQGLTGAVFGIASVVGPATGGWITDNASWRWAFFVSLPFGALALAVVWRGFTMEPAHRSHRVDYVGAALLTGGVSAGLLATVWGGIEYPWGSPEIVGLFLACAVLLGAFLFWERRVPEPILPLGLFANRTFAASQVALFVTGAAMFGTIIFIPLFVQGVLGESATSSGAILTPLMLALVGASVLSGQVVSRTGRYKAILLASPLVLAVGFYLLAQLDVHSTTAETTRDMIVVGIGLGLGMQTFVVVVQNAVPQSVMGVATSTTQFFRTIGATVGVTVMGALLTSRLHVELAERLPALELAKLGGASSPGALVAGGAQGLPADVAATLRDALAAAMHPIFVIGLPMMAVAFVATLFIERRELRQTVHERPAKAGRELFDEIGDEFAPEPRASYGRAGGR
ncbi:MAG TPA: MDR family MFS transporter [Gaiellaceae bacterium]|nr:MDR family MFS transporter [Gaiellaceae bacterium]